MFVKRNRGRTTSFRLALYLFCAGILFAGDGLSDAKLRSKYLDLPIGFEANRGQADPGVRFLARSGRSTLMLTSTQAVLKLDRSLVRMKILGGSETPRLVHSELQSEKSNYLSRKRSKKLDHRCCPVRASGLSKHLSRNQLGLLR